jgi:hypothetical protein
MDPMGPRLGSRERRRREQELASAVAAACGAPAKDVEEAQDLWRSRGGCAPADGPLAHVMAKLAGK